LAVLAKVATLAKLALFANNAFANDVVELIYTFTVELPIVMLSEKVGLVTLAKNELLTPSRYNALLDVPVNKEELIVDAPIVIVPLILGLVDNA
jgi:hypothetical protein